MFSFRAGIGLAVFCAGCAFSYFCLSFFRDGWDYFWNSPCGGGKSGCFNRVTVFYALTLPPFILTAWVDLLLQRFQSLKEFIFFLLIPTGFLIGLIVWHSVIDTSDKTVMDWLYGTVPMIGLFLWIGLGSAMGMYKRFFHATVG